MWLFVLFLAIPLIEIALFIQVGGLIGLWPTLLGVILTAVAGSLLVRAQGLDALVRLRQALERGQDPGAALAHGALILAAGMLLITPGFFTDTLGFLFLVPAVRAAILARIAARIRVMAAASGPASPDGNTPDGEVIEAEYTEIRPGARPAPPSSGWTRH